MPRMSVHRPPQILRDALSTRSSWSQRSEAGPFTATDRPPIAVGPGRPGQPGQSMTPRSDSLGSASAGFSIQLAKVQRPPLRDETLERPRLLDWLRAKIHGRVVLLLADAGYGKTTLLADFSRRTRLRTLWYRMDETDRDWTSYLHHLVAAGREHDPSFAPATASLLGEIGVGGPTREAVLDTFIRELPTIAVQGAVLILDDFHLVDDAVDVRHLTRELLARAPERLTVVIASRRMPTVPLSRLRAVGEVAELTTDDLRFDVAETSQLFNETYGRQLAPDVLVDLARRTEGWIASLQLVQAALRDRSPAEIRRFVRSLNGADHEMYDYLAEEVVGDLSEELQRFLMDTSILQAVTPELAEVVSEQDAPGVARLTAAAERLTLLSRLSGGPRTHQRYHPLVREFLEARFRSLDGDEAVAALHRNTAAAATDWPIAAHHYREAGDTVDMLGIVSQAIPTIMGNGQYALAEAFIGPVPPEDRPPGFDLILSRVEMQQGDYDAAITASQAVLDKATDPIQRDYAILNLLTIRLNHGDRDQALALAERLLLETEDPNLRLIADVSVAIVAAAHDGDIEIVNRKLRFMAARQRGTQQHHFGVSMLNLANNSWAQSRPEDVLREVAEAIEALSATSASLELATAMVLRLTALAALGDWEEFGRRVIEYEREGPFRRDPDAIIDVADLMDSYVQPDEFWPLIGGLDEATTHQPSFRSLLVCSQAKAHARRGQHLEAAAVLATHPDEPGTFIPSTSELRFTRAYVACASNDANAALLAEGARESAARQNAHRLRRLSELLIAATTGGRSFNAAIVAEGRVAPWNLTYLSDLIVPRLSLLEADALAVVDSVAHTHPQRWRSDLRRYLDVNGAAVSSEPARLLERVGDRSDVARLRKLARTKRRSMIDANLGKALSRRVADKVYIEDQGRVSIRVGSRVIAGSDVRRKVLALVCLLLTRPDMSTTRDQVLDALWPDLEPSIAINSLNQTLYFLRRVIEESYSDDLTPGYVHHDSEVIWLDPELVTSRSIQARTHIRGIPQPASPDDVERLVDLYRGRFALDFEYEEWTGAYRDNLHAAYLEVVERSVQDDFTNGHFDRGIGIARRALEVDPTAEQIEVSLLRLYKATGAHSAAAEQYAHYATVMREELGIEPPTLESL